MIEQWNRICFLAERLVRRREGAAADFSRLSITLKALNEVNASCWRGDACELCGGVREGLGRVSGHLHTASDVIEQRVSSFISRAVSIKSTCIKSTALMYNAIEALKVGTGIFFICTLLRRIKSHKEI